MLLMLIIALIMACLSDIAFAGEWTKKADMPTGRVLFGIGILDGNEIYTVGGTGNGFLMSQITEVFNIKENKWSKISNSNVARYAHSVESVNGKIYAIGGINNANFWMNTIEEYDPIADKWSFKKNIPSGFGFGASATIDSKIYIIGGWSNFVSSNQLLVYDPANDNWDKKKNLPANNDGGAACAINGKIYFMGGSDIGGGGMAPVTTVWEYDIKSDTWVQKTNMPIARAGHCLVASKGKIYAIGGWSPIGALDIVHIYDPVIDKWLEEEIKMTTSRTWFGSVVLKTGEVVITGGSKNFDGWAFPPQNLLNLTEIFTPDGNNFGVTSRDKLPTTWGNLRSH